MKKRIASLLLCVIMVIAMVAAAVPAIAATDKSTTFTVTADKPTALPGDTITYTVTLGAVQNLRSIKFKLSFPDGLTYESYEVVEDLAKTLNNAEKAEFTESTKVFVVATSKGYTSDADTPLMQFKCTVNEGASGGQKVELVVPDAGDIFDTDYDDIAFTISNATVTIAAEPKPATGISLNKSSATIYTGDSEQLYATVTPLDSTDTVTWSSSNASVATVDDTGKVTAVAPGSAVITAKAGSKTATCNVTVEDAPCTHENKTTISAQDSTCKDRGWDAYKKCTDCGKLFNESGTEISGIPYRELSTTHQIGTPATCTSRAICSVCDKPFGDMADHTYTKKDEKQGAQVSAGTCKDKAVYYYSCTECGRVEGDNDHTFEGNKNSSVHAGGTEVKNAEEPTCSEGGYTGDTYCKGCGVKLNDGEPIAKLIHIDSNKDHKCDREDCKATLSNCSGGTATCKDKAVCDYCGKPYGELDSSTHAGGTYIKNDKAATCNEDGYTGDTYCKGCETKLQDGKPVTKLGHIDADKNHECDRENCKATLSNCSGGTATCKDKAVCDYCGKPYGELNSSNHAGGTEVRNAKDATCTEDGYTGDTYCKGCETKLSSGKSVDKIGHDYESKVTKEPTTTSTGTRTYTCKNCGHSYEEEIAKLPSTSHTHDYAQKFDADGHWDECACGDVQNKEAHKYGEWKVTKEATTSAKGEKEHVCSACKYTETAEIPMLEKNDPAKTDSPQTGDNSHIGLLLALLLVSGSALIGIAAYSKKRKHSAK